MKKFERVIEDGPDIRKKSIRLLDFIMKDLNPEDFTLDEIKKEFNYLTKQKAFGEGINIQFGTKNLNDLVQLGRIEELSESGHYFVTDSGRMFYDRRSQTEDSKETEE